MRRNSALLVFALAASLALLVAAAGSAAPAWPTKGGKGARLQPFGSCANLLAYTKRHALPRVGPWGLGAPGGPLRAVGAPAADAAAGREGGASEVGFSSTNVQEEGVDEPDLVKSNGTTLFVVRGDRLFSVDVRGVRPRLAGSLQLPAGAGYELLLEGDRLLVLARSGAVPIAVPGDAPRSSLLAPARQQTSLIEVDVSDPGAPRIVRSLVFDGDYLSARLVGTVARIVTVSGMPRALPFVRPADATPAATAAARARNRAVVGSSRIGSWLPGYQVKGRRGQTLSRRPLVQCRDVRRPAAYSGLGLLSVLTVDLRKGLAPIDTDSIVADGSTVYASQDNLYVATQRWLAQPLEPTAPEPPRSTTAIHRFDISSPAVTRYSGSGSVSGYLLGQWSMSEHGGVLRVASTEAPAWWGDTRSESESFVTTLGDRDGNLVQLGRLGGLGKGERVYAVRFVGNTGYVVTFRQVDPLYTLDLSTPARPVLLGELKIQGYSAYLHPLGEGLLLGIGQDASAEGRVLGTQLSLFDVSDPRRPVRLRQAALGSGWSEAESDHHAFLWWGASRLAVLPLQSWNERPFVGAVGFRVTRAGIDEVGRVTHTGEASPVSGLRVAGIPVRRTLVVGDTLYTVSDAGVKAVSLSSFAERGWAAFSA